MTSSRGRIIWFLCCLTLVGGLLSASSQVSHAQSTPTFKLSGTVTDKDGEPVVGYTVRAIVVNDSGVRNTRITQPPFTTRANGSYDLVFFSLSEGRIFLGDTLVVEVYLPGELVPENKVGGASHVVTAADIASGQAVAGPNIQLSELSADLSLSALPADGMSTATLTVSVKSGGEAVIGDTLTISTEEGKGSITDITDVGDGTYTAVYTAPELTLAAPTSDTLTVESTTLGATTSVKITLDIVPTKVEVTVSREQFTVGKGGTADVTISVTRGGKGVSGSVITVTADAGTVASEITEIGNGGYSTTYTPSTVAGRATITATEGDSEASGSVTVTVNAGEATNLSVTANLTTVSSGGQAVITATVSDASGNGVGGLTLSGSANSGTLSAFAEGSTIGSYIATYTAPTTVEAKSDAVVTVLSGALTGVATISLTPKPPVTVGIIVVSGTVKKQGGTGTVPDMNVAVKVGEHPMQSATSGSDGGYSVTIFDLGGNAASTGDGVLVVVTDGDGVERGRSNKPLTNEDLGEGGEATVTRHVETDILATSLTLVVSGAVFREASEIPVDDVFDITVTNENRGEPMSAKTNANGMYTTTFLPTTGFAAETGDTLDVIALRNGARVGTASYQLTSEDVDAGQVTVNVPTSIKALTPALLVTGTVYHEDGAIAVGSGLSVEVKNAARGLDSSDVTDANGGFQVQFLETSGPAAETGDTLSVSVMKDGAQIGNATHDLTSAEVDAGHATVPVTTDAKASTSNLVVSGAVYFVVVDSEVDSKINVGEGIPVKVEIGDTMQAETVETDANGMYSATFLRTTRPVAETGDSVTATIMYKAAEGSASRELLATEIDAGSASSLDIATTIKAKSSVFNVSGTVFLEDNKSPATGNVFDGDKRVQLPLTVKIINTNTRHDPDLDVEGSTNKDDGSYSVTFVSTGMVKAAMSGDELTCDVMVMAGGEPVGSASHTLSTNEVVARQAVDVNIKTTLTAAPSNLIVVDGLVSNPDDTPAADGIEVRVYLVGKDEKVVEKVVFTRTNGRYSATFFDSLMPVVKVHDKLNIQAVDRTAGAAANESREIRSEDVLLQRVEFPISLIADEILPVPKTKYVDLIRRKKFDGPTKLFVDPMNAVEFDGSESSDNITPTIRGVIEKYLWDFGDGNTAETAKHTHQYAEPGKYTATLTVHDLAGNKAMAEVTVFVGTVRLGGMALNTVHGRIVLDKILSLALERTDLAQSKGGAEKLIADLRADPASYQAVADAIAKVVPKGAVPMQLLKADVPIIFEDYENVDLENFGNAITAYPGDVGILNSEKPGVGRVVNGDKLDLYLVAPREAVGNVTFRFYDIDGIDSVEAGTRDATRVMPGETFPHTFHLEEEQARLVMPVMQSADGAMSVFESVTLKYRGDELRAEYQNLLSRARHMPGEYGSATLNPTTINGKTVWTAEVDIEPGKIYRYYYEVTLATPIEIDMGDGQPMSMAKYAFPDPRNLQVQDRGVIEAIFTPALQEAIASLLNPILNAIDAGQSPDFNNLLLDLTGEQFVDLTVAIIGSAAQLYSDVFSTHDPHIDSVFTVPMVTEDQSLWYGTIDLSAMDDGEYFIDANAFDDEGVQIDNRPVFGKSFMLDRSAPEYGVTVEEGENARMYMSDDGFWIATGAPDMVKATLRLTATRKAGLDTGEVGDFAYQVRRLNDDPMALQSAWRDIADADMPPLMGAITANESALFLLNSVNNMLWINERAGRVGPSVKPINMAIRGMNNDPALMVGSYDFRVIARDSVLNFSSDTETVRVDIVPPEADTAKITNIGLGNRNKDNDLDDPFESAPPPGEDLTIFANTPSVTLTIEIDRSDHPLAKLVVEYKTAHGTGMWKTIEEVDVSGIVDAVDGKAVHSVDWNIDDFNALIDGGGDPHVYVRAVATNALRITDPQPAMTTIKLDPGVCPVEPDHIAVDVVPAGTNPETGGACGIITVNGYTAVRTIPDIASVQFVITMPNGTEMTIDTDESEILSALDTADLTAVVGNLVDTIAFGEQATAAQEVGYRKWSVTFNTAPLADSLDTPYVVNATMIGADGTEYAPIAGGTDSFTLHNGDVEVGTMITSVADAYGQIEAGDAAFHQLGGILPAALDTTTAILTADPVTILVDQPVAILTVDPVAPDWRVKTVKLIAHTRNADGSKGDPVDVGEWTVEDTVTVDDADMTKDSSDKIFTITVSDLSVLGVGGDYVFQALAVDHKAEPDVEAEDASYGTAINVDNYAGAESITIDGRGEGMSLADFMTAHPLGYRIAQSDNNAFPFSLNVPGVLAGDLTVQIDDGTLAADLVTIDGTRHEFSIVASASTTDEGDHPASVTVTKRNGSVSFDLVNLAIDRVAPVITVLSPIEDTEVSALPSIRSIYNDGAGYGIAVAPTDPLDVAADVEILITRQMPPDEVSVPVNQDELEDTDDSVVYSPDNKLAGGAYRTDVSVTDKWGNRSSASAEFTVVGTPPSVTILSPMADSVSDDGMPLISASLAGTGALDVVFTIDGEAIEGAVDGNNLSYTPESPLAEGDHTVMIRVTDPDGKTAEASVTFSVELDHSPPVVTQVSPTGIVWGPDITLSVTAIDDQSGVASVSIALDGGDAVDGASRDVEGLAAGNHEAVATVTNGDGYSQEYSWTFAIALDEEPPTIGTSSPHGIVRTTTPTISVSATDIAGIASIEIGVMNANGDVVEGETTASEDGTSASFAPGGELANGAYAVAVVVTDHAGNTANANWTFTVEADYDTTNPSINVVSPQGIVRVEMPTVSVSASDASDTGKQDLSGIADIAISVAGSDGAAVDGSVDFDGEGSAVFTPGGALANGEYTASATVTDNSGNENSASWTFTVEVIRDEARPIIGVSSPSGIVRVDNPTISISATDAMSGVGNIEISLAASDGAAVDGASEYDGGTMGAFAPSAALANDTYTATAVVTDNVGNQSTASWSFTVEVDTAEPNIGNTSPQGISRVAMPEISVAASDELTGIASIEISVMNSAGDAVDGSTAMGDGSAVFVPNAALANDTYTASTVVTDNSGNVSTASWSFVVEVVMDVAPPAIGTTSPSGIVRIAMPTISVSATDDLSGVASIDISVTAGDGSAVDGGSEFDGATMAIFTPGGELANDTYTATAVVTDNAGNETKGSWSFTVEVVTDTTPPTISAYSPQGLVRNDTPMVTVSATDDMSGVAGIEIAVSNSNGQVGGAGSFDAGIGTFAPARDLGNDTYTVNAVVSDNAGNTASVEWTFTLEADDTEPVIGALSPQGIVRTDTPRLTVSATDGISGIASIEIRLLDPGLAPVAGSTIYEGGTSAAFVPANGLANGTYSAAVNVTDKAGNTANASWSFTLEADRAAPVINTTSPQGTIRSDTPRVSVAATDDLSGIASIEIRVFNSALVRIGGPTVFEGGTRAHFTPANPLRNDTYTVGVDVTDKAGNETNASWSFTVQVDTTPPVISANSPLGIVRDEMPRVSVNATDDESGIQNIEIRVLNSAFERIGGPTQFTGGTNAVFTPNRKLRNDTYTVGVTAVDKSGNRADASWTFVLEADHTPPVINATSPQGIIRDETPRISVSATDNISGIASFQIRVYDSRFVRVAGPTTFEGGTVAYFTPSNDMKNDTYTVGVKVTDKAGNTTDADWAFTIEVDKVPPTIGDTGPHGIIRSATPRVTVSATDDLSGVKSVAIRVIDAAFNRVAGVTTFQGGTFASFSPTGNLDNGVYSVGVDVTDKSGNVASTGWSFTVEVDTVPPTIGHTSPSGSVRPENPMISVSATDDLSGIASIQIALLDRNRNAVGGQTIFEGGTIGTFIPSRSLDYGTHYVSVKVKDKAGNLANATYSFTVESADGLAVRNARNFPNPFAGATKIAFTLTRASEVSIEIFDISMRPVWHMSPRMIEATKEHVIGWEGTTTGGEKLARGVYFCQIIVHDSLNPQHTVLKMAIK